MFSMAIEEKSVSRRSTTPVKIYCLPEEKEIIQAKAEAAGLSASSYLLKLGMDYEVSGILDYERVEDLARVNGDLGRLGGLLKMWLSNDERIAQFQRPQIQKTILAVLSRIDKNQELIRDAMCHVVKGKNFSG